MPTSNIDDLLMGGGNSHQPEAPEEKYMDKPLEVDEYEAPDELEPEDEPDSRPEPARDEPEQEPEEHAKEYDDYGNEKVPDNEAIRERLARQARKHEAEIADLRAQLAERGASQQVQNAAEDFEYDPNASGDWQQQLASFVKQTVNSMSREQEESKQRVEQQKLDAEFQSKFRDGMSNFSDFVDVVESLPFQITNPMTLATRAMDNPAAFLYAAAKRNPQELERISKIRDPYAQMTEMGRLEERMRKNKQTTKAPRPLGRTTEDASIPQAKKKKEASIEDLIAHSDATRLKRLKGLPGRKR